MRASYHAYTLNDAFQPKLKMLTGQKRPTGSLREIFSGAREDMKSIVIIGAGRGVTPLIEHLTSMGDVAVNGIVDKD